MVMSAQWGAITAKEIQEAVNARLISGGKKTVFSAISTDSRTTKPGDLFWTIKGERFDGHDFIGTALDRGAVGVVFQKDHPLKVNAPHTTVMMGVADTLRAFGDLARWWRHRHRIQVIAVTGSTGKTTTKEMIGAILALHSRTLVTQGNFNNLIGLPLTLFQLTKEHHSAVLEMGMNQPGEIARLTEIADPDIGVITNIGMAHLEGVGSIQGVARAKGELIEKLSEKGHIIINGDDKRLMETASSFKRKCITFGFGAENTFCCEKVEHMDLNGSRFLLRYKQETFPVTLNIPGKHNVANAMAAAAACAYLHVPAESISEGLARFKGVDSRFSLIPLPGGAVLVDDTYNANPASLKAALESVSEIRPADGRLIVGLGDMMELGDAAPGAHREAGRLVAQARADHLLVMGEHAGETVTGTKEAGLSEARVCVVMSHRQMSERIENLIKEGDMILLKGSRKMDLGKVVERLKRGAD